MKIYVASSWRNAHQQAVVERLRAEGHEVYDFRNPLPDNHGFHWSDIDPGWKQWTPEQFRTSLDHPVAEAGYGLDWEAMQWADACVMVMPCGRSAHIEAGYFVGAGKPLIILLSDGEPELMYKMANAVCVDMEEVVQELQKPLIICEDPRLLQLARAIVDRGYFVCASAYPEDCSYRIMDGKYACVKCIIDDLNSTRDLPTCRNCGCTDDYACDGGCSWVEPDLCSACVDGEGR